MSGEQPKEVVRRGAMGCEGGLEGERTDVVLVAVQDGLVAPELLTNADEGGDDAQAELAALDRGRDGDVFDVAYEACV